MESRRKRRMWLVTRTNGPHTTGLSFATSPEKSSAAELCARSMKQVPPVEGASTLAS